MTASESESTRDRLIDDLIDEGINSGFDKPNRPIQKVIDQARRQFSLFETLWSAQSGLCAICGEPMPRGRFDVAHATLWKKQRPTFDHIRPRNKGGGDQPENLQLAHAECNWIKGDSWKP